MERKSIEKIRLNVSEFLVLRNKVFLNKKTGYIYH